MNNILKTTVVAGFAAMLGSASLFAQNAAASAPAAATKDAWYMPSVDKLSASVAVGYESVHVFRGKYQTTDNIQASIDVGYSIIDNDGIGGALGVYAGVWNNAPLTSEYWLNAQNETDLTAGFTYAIKGFVFDLGYTYYWYNTAAGDYKPGDTHELKFGVAYDTSALIGEYLGGATITPSAYYYYDFDRMANSVEVALSSSLPVSQWAFGKDFLSVEASIFYGYVTQDRYNASNMFGAVRSTNSYNYIGATADLVWRVNDICSVRTGIRWAANDDGEKYGFNQNAKSDNNLWWGASIAIGF